MPAKSSRIWVTRAQPQAEATAARLRTLGFTPVVAPVLEIRPIADVVVDLAGVDALAFTSAAGVSAFAALSAARDLVVFAVGDATAEAARDAGFKAVHSSGGGAQALAGLIVAAQPRPALVLNPTTAEPAADLPALLAGCGVAGRAIAVYAARETEPADPPEHIDGVLIHSSRAARAVADLLRGSDVSALTAYAISVAAAVPLAGLAFRRIAVAPFPNESALLNLLQD